MASSSLQASLINRSKLPHPPSPVISAAKTPPPAFFLLHLCHNFKEITQLHGQMVVSGQFNHSPTAGKLVESYVSVSQFDIAVSVFRKIKLPNVFTFNTAIRALLLSNRPHDSILLYSDLLMAGREPDTHSYTFVLKACSRLKAIVEGKQIHCRLIKIGNEIRLHSYVRSSLINMYAASGSMDLAQQVFDELPEENVDVKNSMISGYINNGDVEKALETFDNMTVRDTASWSAMVAGYTKNGLYTEALLIFREMTAAGVELNESALVSALSACARSSALDQGRWIHLYIEKKGIAITARLGHALIDMYAKCGCIESSYQVFDDLPHRDFMVWGAMISGLAAHGEADACFKLFDQMVAGGTSPNDVHFLSLLSACAHTGKVQSGLNFFHQMVNLYKIKPSIEHCGCIVDLLSRPGLLEEAETLISSMAENPNSAIWGALLSDCRTHRDLERGERAAKLLMAVEPMSGDRCKAAARLFDDMGEREEAIEIRKMVRLKGLKSRNGCSAIEVDGEAHEFVVGESQMSMAGEIHAILDGNG